MTLYNPVLYNPMSSDGFSPVQDKANQFVAGFWQVEETGFQPSYGSATHLQKCIVEDAVNSSEDDCANGRGEDEEQLFADTLSQKTADAYAQGYLDGQQAIAAQFDEDQERQNALATALHRLKPTDEAKPAKLLWEAVLSLFRQAVGDAQIDRELMQQRCEAALESIAIEMGEASLHVAPADACILVEHDCGVPVVADPDLLPGSVRLVYASGQVTSGSLSIEQAIEDRVGAPSC